MPKTNDAAPKVRWVKLTADYGEHKAGDKVALKKKDAKALIAEQKAVEASDPAKKSILKALGTLREEVTKDLSDKAKKELAEMLKATADASQRFNPGNLGAALNKEQQGKVIDKGIGTLWDEHGRYIGNNGVSGQGIGMAGFLQDFWSYNHTATDEKRKTLAEKYDCVPSHVASKASSTPLAEAAGVTGGYTVPIEFSMRLLQLAIQNQVVRPRAFIQPMTARSIRIPYLDVTTAQNAGVTAFLGGMQVGWTEEAQAKPEYEPQFKQLELVAHELSALTLSSNQLLADNAIGLDSFLSQIFAKAVGWFSDYAFLQGNGSGKPLGILNAPASVVVTRQTANTFKVVDAVTMLSKLLTTSMGSAVWIMSQTIIPQLYQLQDAAGRNIFLPNPQAPGGGAAQTPPMSLFGLPIIFTEKLPALGTKGDVMLADLQYYVIGDRMQLEIQASVHRYFEKAQTAWRVIQRVDGQPWMDAGITLADGVTVVSPFVVLS